MGVCESISFGSDTEVVGYADAFRASSRAIPHKFQAGFVFPFSPVNGL